MLLLRPLSISFAAMTLLTGLVYPVTITGIARIAFPDKASGSLLTVNHQVRGSRLIAQATEDPRYFSGRPSSTNPFPTNAAASAGSTLAASNPALGQSVMQRVRALQAANPGQSDPIPQDLVSASASGLDPHISPEAARWQVLRIAGTRGLEQAIVQHLIDTHIESGFLSPERVDVLELNQALDELRRR
jgi:K+-transporting ATPase ATPase C chain